MTRELHAHSGHFRRRTEAVQRPTIAGIASRIVLTLAGAGGMIAGALSEWYRPDHLTAVQLPTRMFVAPVFRFEARLMASAGFVVVLLASLAIVGLAARSGWITRLAGALSVVAVGMFAVSVKRSGISDLPSAIGWGAWMTLVGAVVTLVAGLRGTYARTTDVVESSEPEAEEAVE